MNEKLKNEIARKLHKMDTNLLDTEKVHLRWLFMDKFIRCEVAVKKVLTAYHKHRGDKDKGFERLDMRSIPKALEWAGFEIPRTELDALFSGSGKFGKVGTKSAKKLRDGVTHEHNESDIREIAARFDELDALMDEFLRHFRWTEEELKSKKKAKRTEEALPV